MRSIAIVIMIGCIPSLPASDVKLSVGFAEVDVTPDITKKPVFLAGFGQNRMATKVHDPLMARAIVLSDGSKKVAMVSIDIVGLFLPSVEDVRNKLQGFDYVLVSSTHNHEGPDTLGLWGKSPFQSGIDPAYLNHVIEGAVLAVQQASKHMRHARAIVGSAKGPELLHDARLPKVLHDDLVAIQFLEPESDKSLGLFVQWHVHPELLGGENTELSADHVGYTVSYLKKRLHCPVVYFTGTVGGLMTSLHVPLKDSQGRELKDGTFEKTEQYGIKVGQLAEKALQQNESVNMVPFNIRSKSFLVPMDNQLYRVAASAGVLKRKMYAWDPNNNEQKFVECNDITKPIALHTELGYLKLGHIEIAAIPGEIYPELVLGKIQNPVDPNADFPDAPQEPAIFSHFKSKHPILIGLANDEIGYIIPKRQWDEKKPYCYGLTKSQYGEINSVGPETAPIICHQFQRLVLEK